MLRSQIMSRGEIISVKNSIHHEFKKSMIFVHGDLKNYKIYMHKKNWYHFKK